MALTPFEQEVGVIYDFLGDVYPDSQIMRPYEEGDIDELFRLHQAGFGLAEVIRADGETDIVTYIRDEDAISVRAIVAIADAENNGELELGSHVLALDSIKFGMPFPILDFFIQSQP
jgi:hypothetical protein